MSFASKKAIFFCAAALLAGCGGSQLPIAMPQAATSAARAMVRSELVHPIAHGPALPYHHTFYYIGRRQAFIVPAHVTRIAVVALGAAGGGPVGRKTGRGGRISAILPVTPGEKLVVFVGGAGRHARGGFNGGGAGGFNGESFTADGGGGASDVRRGDDRLEHRILAAGGGGGQGAQGSDRYFSGAGGDGGGLVGERGWPGHGNAIGGGGGRGGTQTHGGSGGAGGKGVLGYGHSGARGSLGVGGYGGGCRSSPSCNLGGAGGGGGGGYYGGGGGGQGGQSDNSATTGGGGGGGGSSYAGPNMLDFHSWQGWYTATNNGLVVFSWK